MDLNRRNFLQIVGLGAAAASTPASARIFTEGSPDTPLLTGEHWVFESHCALKGDAKAHFLYKNHAGEISQILMRRGTGSMRVRGQKAQNWREPRKERPFTWSPRGETVDYQVQQVHLGHDPGFDFFMAASELQRQINEDVTKFAAALRRNSLVMITVVETPIIAMPHAEGGGIGLITQLTQFAAEKDAIWGEPISKKGEVPIEMPGDVEFHYLTKMQEELKAMGMLEGWQNFSSRRRTQIAEDAHKRLLISGRMKI